MCYVQWNITKIKEKEYLARVKKKYFFSFSSLAHIDDFASHVQYSDQTEWQKPTTERLEIKNIFQLIWETETHTAVVDSVKYSSQHLEYYFLRIFLHIREMVIVIERLGSEVGNCETFFFRCFAYPQKIHNTTKNESENSLFHLFYKFCDYLKSFSSL